MLNMKNIYGFVVVASILLKVNCKSYRDFLGKKYINLCKDVPSCKCTREKWKSTANNSWITARCKSPLKSEINIVGRMNVTELIVTQATNHDTREMFKVLQNANTTIKEISLITSELKSFNLALLPESVVRMAFNGRSTTAEVLSTNCTHENQRIRLLQHLAFYLTGHETLDLKCLPDSITLLTIWDARSIRKFSWPKSLIRIAIVDTKTGYPIDALARIGSTVTSMYVSYSPVSDGIMPKVIGSENITHIAISYCNISYIPEDTFVHNKRLWTIRLDGNVLKTFQAKIPSSLRGLHLQYNKIETFNATYAVGTQLQHIQLDKNLMTACPTGLPGTLRRLVLRKNIIDRCSPEAFRGLTELKALDLSYNKMRIMPRGIPSKLDFYYLQSNQLSHIYGPENYNFCSECTGFDIRDNPWFCDIRFFEFLLWANQVKGNSLKTLSHFLIRGNCANPPKYAFSSEYLKEAAEYTTYISRPIMKCRYEPLLLLNCTKANLTIFPDPPPRGLKKVIVAENEQLKVVPDHVFAYQQTLKSVTLRWNCLKRIPYGLPSSVEWLDMRGNNITEFISKDVAAFQNLTKLEQLILDDNHIKTVLSQDFRALKSLNWVGLDGNELVCDCSLHSFIIWYRKLNLQYSSDDYMIRYAKCTSPKQIEQRDIRGLYYYYEYELRCIPIACIWNETTLEPILNCSITVQQDEFSMVLQKFSGPIQGKFPRILAKRYWEKIYLNGLKLTNDDVIMDEFIQLTDVDLSENLLTRWVPKQFPVSLKTLNLNRNQIQNIPNFDVVSKYLPNLEKVNLCDNKIITVTPPQTATLAVLKEFFIEGNPVQCSCAMTSFKLWMSGNSTLTWSKNDAKLLKCHWPADLKGQKLIGLTEEKLCQSTSQVDIKIWISVGLFIMVIGLSMLVSILVYRKRRHQKQILSGFRKLLQEEASHNFVSEGSKLTVTESPQTTTYEFDAFVATEESDYDGEFVEKLTKELEQKRNFKLCISTRDFMPGMDISDNIIKSIKSSKRVILIISKNFVESPWCQYKVQVALAELHTRQRKLLIPVVLEDLTDSTTNGIKTFISLIPTSKAPHRHSSHREWDKFWNTISDAILN